MGKEFCSTYYFRNTDSFPLMTPPAPGALESTTGSSDLAHRGEMSENLENMQVSMSKA